MTQGTKRTRHVWFVNHHAAIPSRDGGSGRHLKLSRLLPEHGWRASLIIASTKHPSGIQGMPNGALYRVTNEGGVPTLWVRTVAYARSSVRRALGMASFAILLTLPKATKKLDPPDVIVGSTVHLLAAWAGMHLANRKRVPFIYEIRDVWPETLIDAGSIREGSLGVRLMRWLSVRLASRAQLVMSPLPHVDRYLAENGLTEVPFMSLPNGVEPRTQLCNLRESGDRFTFMYLGAVGWANALQAVLDAFDEASRRLPKNKLQLRIVGEGNARAQLMKYASGLPSAESITFEGRIPEEQVINRAREADVLVANMHDLPVYRFGVGLNKLSMYMSAGRPILFGTSAANDPILESNAGISVPANDVKAMAQAMLLLHGCPKSTRDEYARNGFNYVSKEYDYRLLAKKLALRLDEILSEQE